MRGREREKVRRSSGRREKEGKGYGKKKLRRKRIRTCYRKERGTKLMSSGWRKKQRRKRGN